MKLAVTGELAVTKLATTNVNHKIRSHVTKELKLVDSP